MAGYVDGIYAWPEAGWQRFRSSVLIGIAVNPNTNGGEALDVETGDATPDQAPAWVKMRRAAGVAQPWVYCNRSNRPLVESALQLAGITADQVGLWVATLDGTRVVTNGPYPVLAVQWANSVLAGGHYDISSTTDAYSAAGGALGTLGGLELKIQPPFTVVTDGDTHWFGTPAGQDMGLMGGRSVTVTTVSADGQWFEYPGSSWWFPASKSSLVLPTSTSDDDSAFLTKAALKAAVNGL